MPDPASCLGAPWEVVNVSINQVQQRSQRAGKRKQSPKYDREHVSETKGNVALKHHRCPSTHRTADSRGRGGHAVLPGLLVKAIYGKSQCEVWVLGRSVGVTHT